MPTRNRKGPPDVRTVRSADGLLVFIGRPVPTGCYVLRFDLPDRVQLSCGRFKRGKGITFEPGSYLYVGSAMARRGPSSLSGRLTRHAARLYGGEPHPILRLMLDQFPRFGLGGEPAAGGGAKLPKWNVDWPLDQPRARLTAAYAVRSLWPFEGFLGKCLEQDPAVVVFERGLGAGDIRGNTHLLRVDAGEPWWDRLPGRLAEFLPRGEHLAGLALRLGQKLVTPDLGLRLTPPMLKELRGRWHERAAELLRLMARRSSFDAALGGTEHVYDTPRWDKVPSRLSRGRGSVLLALSNLRSRRDALVTISSQRDSLIDLTRELVADVRRLRGVIAGVAGAAVQTPDLPLPAATTTVLTSYAQVEGKLTGCRRFLRKNIHDVPLIEARTRTSPTPGNLRSALRELAWIEAAARQIGELCRVRSRNGNTLGRSGSTVPEAE